MAVGVDARAGDSAIFQNPTLNVSMVNGLLKWPTGGLCVGGHVISLRPNLLKLCPYRGLTFSTIDYRGHDVLPKTHLVFWALCFAFSVDRFHSLSIPQKCRAYFPPGSIDDEDVSTDEISHGVWQSVSTAMYQSAPSLHPTTTKSMERKLGNCTYRNL
ncbi:hypothetical protein PR048_016862 [Dryococelus australis]|uniref:Uncharacterized protein n=1 Tax=Dryococelus australis TaxID=614101 RepID=A0ABQ9H7X7_9NEOP|nr:hypothetical protein PR048_016862 [Dryococelus australis]